MKYSKSRAARGAMVVAAVGLVVAASGCSVAPSASSGDGGVSVVASTDVYGNIVAAIGGPSVTVASIIDDPSKDPHEYAADAQNQLALARADIVVENGGGYDDFVDTMLSATNGAHPVVLNVADLSGYDQAPASGSFNEHLWYDFPTMEVVTTAIAQALSNADPAHASTFASNAEAFTASLKALEGREADVKAHHAGKGVAITEPVPLYMLTAMGLENRTPPKFSESVEQDTDTPADVLQATLDLFSTHQVSVLAYNAQTSGPQTAAVVGAAKQNGIPAVPVTETLPSGETYLTWMGHNIDAISAALGS